MRPCQGQVVGAASEKERHVAFGLRLCFFSATLIQSDYLGDMSRTVFERVGDAAPVQVVGGLSVAQAKRLGGGGGCAPSSSAAISASREDETYPSRHSPHSPHLQKPVAGRGFMSGRKDEEGFNP